MPLILSTAVVTPYLHVLLWEKYCMILYSSLIHVCLHTLKNTVVSMYSYAKVGLLHRHRMKLSQFLSFLKLTDISRLRSTNYATDITSSHIHAYMSHHHMHAHEYNTAMTVNVAPFILSSHRALLRRRYVLRARRGLPAGRARLRRLHVRGKSTTTCSFTHKTRFHWINLFRTTTTDSLCNLVVTV